MKRLIVIIALFSILTLLVSLFGCEKEKLVESTEYVHEVQYVEMPADTVYRVDTVFSPDSVTVEDPDTVFVPDTVIQVEFVYDTVEVVEDHYDTVEITDTVEIKQCDPNQHFALAALEYYCDPVVLEIIRQDYGITDGWVFYLSEFQVYMAQQSSDVYDVFGYIDYWTPDWSGFSAFEYYWRMTFIGGDAADVNNWEMSLPPAATATYEPGLRRSQSGGASHRSLR